MSILPQATAQTKKETHRGALTLQIPFQGKMTEKGDLVAHCNEHGYHIPHSSSTSISRCPHFQLKGYWIPKYKWTPPLNPTLNHSNPKWNISPNSSPPPLPCQGKLHKGLSINGNLIQNWESHLKRYTNNLAKISLYSPPQSQTSVLAKCLPNHLNTSP